MIYVPLYGLKKSLHLIVSSSPSKLQLFSFFCKFEHFIQKIVFRRWLYDKIWDQFWLWSKFLLPTIDIMQHAIVKFESLTISFWAGVHELKTQIHVTNVHLLAHIVDEFLCWKDSNMESLDLYIWNHLLFSKFKLFDNPKETFLKIIERSQ